MFLTILFAPAALGAEDGECLEWGSAQEVAPIANPALIELSGMAASRLSPGTFWGHNDDGAYLYALGEDGSDQGSFFVPGAEDEDWEDIAYGPCGDGCGCLYIADTGDNDLTRSEAVLYRLPEPAPLGAGESGQTAVPTAIPFRYPLGKHDAEALAIHPLTGETLIFTKEDPAYVYTFPDSPPQPDSELILLGSLDIEDFGAEQGTITAASVSPLGRWIALRTDKDVILLRVPESGRLKDALTVARAPLDAPPEQQAEALAFSLDGETLYMAGEQAEPELWAIACASFEPSADTAEPLEDCAADPVEVEPETCGCRAEEKAALLPLALLGAAGLRRRRAARVLDAR